MWKRIIARAKTLSTCHGDFPQVKKAKQSNQEQEQTLEALPHFFSCNMLHLYFLLRFSMEFFTQVTESNMQVDKGNNTDVSEIILTVCIFKM